MKKQQALFPDLDLLNFKGPKLPKNSRIAKAQRVLHNYNLGKASLVDVFRAFDWPNPEQAARDYTPPIIILHD